MKEFAQFRLDTQNQCLWRHTDTGGDERILLTPKGFAVLRYLVEHAGRLVTQDELLDAVWPETHVQPHVLNPQIFNIRKILDDHPKNPVFIETMPRRGYRFIAPVRDSTSLGVDLRSGKLVGRETALGELRDSLEKALKGQRQIVFITGEPGIGKTALADEFRRQAAAAVPGIRVVRGQCVEGYGGKEPYYPMLEALGQLCRGPGGDSIVRTLATQAPTWLVQFPAMMKREDREMLQREILGATRERMLREIGDALEVITEASPLLMVFEDLGWVDPSTVDLLSALARRQGPAKLMIAATYRPAELESVNRPFKALTEDLLVHRLCREIALEPLTEAEITEHLASPSECKPPEALSELVYRRSEGNPLFMVAALEHWCERGWIRREEGGWRLRVSPGEIDPGVPEGLGKMIEAQIERLSPEEQRVLEAASVAGVVFAASVSAAAATMDEEKFEDICEELSRRQHMLRRSESYQFADGTVSQRYEFTHALYRDVFYRRQAPWRRAKLHLEIGKRLEALCAGTAREAAGELADHFEQGRDWSRAIRHLELAADTAGRRFAPQQAGEILEHALSLVKKLPDADRAAQEITILEKLAAIYLAWVRAATGTG